MTKDSMNVRSYRRGGKTHSLVSLFVPPSGQKQQPDGISLIFVRMNLNVFWLPPELFRPKFPFVHRNISFFFHCGHSMTFPSELHYQAKASTLRRCISLCHRERLCHKNTPYSSTFRPDIYIIAPQIVTMWYCEM